MAQDSEDEQVIEKQVVITGYLGSLKTSTETKRNSVGFVDEIFSDDIGKMPSQNLAESLSRIPGVKISREVTGEGQQITVRGLGSEFTKVVMNGNSIAVASDGSMGSGQRDRHVDLDMFPPKPFSSLAVNKTMTADQVEGGVSGYVNLRTLHALDLGKGSNFRFSIEGAYNENASSTSPRISAIYGNNSDNLGILVGVVSKKSETRMDGWETVIDYNEGCVVDWNPPGTGGCVPGSTSPNNFNYASYATPDYHDVLQSGPSFPAQRTEYSLSPQLHNGIVSFDWATVKDAVDYTNFNPGEAGTGDQFGQTVGDINEEAEVRLSPLLLGTEHAQVDFSASYKLPVLQDYGLTLTFDAYNLTGEPLHTFWESDGHTYNYFYPGATYTFGIKGSF